MDKNLKNSSDLFKKVQRINDSLESSLKRQTGLIERRRSLAEMEWREIANARKSIDIELSKNRRSSQLADVACDPPVVYPAENVKELKKASVALVQSKRMFSNAIEKAKSFSLPSVGNADEMHLEKKKLNGLFMPKSIYECSTDLKTANLHKQEELKPSEKVRLYIQHLDDVEKDVHEDLVEQTEHCHLQNRQSFEVLSTSRNNGELAPKKKFTLGADELKDYDSCKPKSKFITRRHSVLGVSLNIPVAIAEPTKCRRNSIANNVDWQISPDFRHRKTGNVPRKKMQLGIDQTDALLDKNRNSREKFTTMRSDATFRNRNNIGRSVGSHNLLRRNSLPEIRSATPMFLGDIKRNSTFLRLDEISSSDGRSSSLAKVSFDSEKD
eukprot:gene17336-8916_t